MTTTYPDISAGVNEPEEPQHNFYAFIPAPVLVSKELQPAAKLMYGHIAALTTIQGFCWASNAYFMKLCDVDRATVKRWLAALVNAKFIAVEVNPVTNERRIYLLAMPSGGVAQKCATPSAKMNPPQRKNAPQSITENNTKSITSTLNVVGEPSPSAKQGPKEGEKVTPPASAVWDMNTGNVTNQALSWKVKALEDAIASTKDAKSSKRFQQLLDIADNAGLAECWQGALDALEQRRRAAGGPVERPGAYFCSVLVSALNARGVAVPVGSPSARRSVKASIAASFAAAGEEAEVQQ